MQRNNSERGNAFLFILIAVVLFAALSFTVSKGFRGGGTTKLSEREIDLAASAILNYAQRAARVVDRLRRDGCSENDISFDDDQWGHTDYRHTPVASDNCKVFHPDGGNLEFQTPQSLGLQTISVFRYNGSNRVETFGCDDQTNPRCSELVVEINMNESSEVCLKINDLLDIENPSGDAPRLSEWTDGAAFAGDFATSASLVGGSDATNEAPQVNGKSGGCVFEFNGGQNVYHFYYVLISR